jgi:hypothetical protein
MRQGLTNFCASWPDPLTFTFQVARITGMNHYTQLAFVFRKLERGALGEIQTSICFPSWKIFLLSEEAGPAFLRGLVPTHIT